MKIMYINTVYAKGSTGNIVRSLAHFAKSRGANYSIAVRESNSEEDVYKIGNRISVYAHAFLSRITDRAGLYSTNETKKLIAYIKRYNPDIIHMHNLHGYYLNYKVLFDYLKNSYPGKVVWTLHDCWAFTGHCAYYSISHCFKWYETEGGGVTNAPKQRHILAVM